MGIDPINFVNRRDPESKRARLDGKEPAEAPYFSESSKVAEATSASHFQALSSSLTNSDGKPPRMTKQRRGVIDMLKNIQKSDAAKKCRGSLMCKVADSRLLVLTY